MKTSVVAILFLFAIVLPCQARWGFTYEECLKQYGKPAKERKDKVTNVVRSVTFNMNGAVIRAFFKNKRVNRVTYRRADDNSITSTTLLKILSAYSDKERDLYFQPPETLDLFSTLSDTMTKEKILAESVKQQFWVRSSDKSAVTLLAVYNRTAKMLVIEALSTKKKTALEKVGF